MLCVQSHFIVLLKSDLDVNKPTTYALTKALALTVNIRLDWKTMPNANTLAYLYCVSAAKKFLNSATGQSHKNFLFLCLRPFGQMSYSFCP